MLFFKSVMMWGLLFCLWLSAGFKLPHGKIVLENIVIWIVKFIKSFCWSLFISWIWTQIVSAVSLINCLVFISEIILSSDFLELKIDWEMISNVCEYDTIVYVVLLIRCPDYDLSCSTFVCYSCWFSCERLTRTVI